MPRLTLLSPSWRTNPMVRGSITLVTNNVAATALGFVAWVVTTRLFEVGAVGSAGAAIALASLVANIAFLGAPGTVVRFVPSSADRAALVRTALVITLGAAVVIAVPVGLVSGSGAQDGARMWSDLLVFVCFVVALVAKAVLEAAAIGTRASHLALLATLAGNATKIGVILVLGWFAAQALGIVVAQLVAATVGVAVLARALSRSGLLSSPRSRLVDAAVLRRVGGYAGSSYLNALVGGLPLLVLPVLVRARLGPEDAGYWYVASLIASAMTLVSSGVGQSLLVEASHERDRLRPLAWRALGWLMALAAPMAAVAFAVAPWILGIFGPGYANGSLSALRVLIVSTLFSPSIYVLGTVFFVRRRILPLVIGNAVNAVVVIGLAAVATQIVDVAWAWLIGELVYLGLFLLFLMVFHEKPGGGVGAGTAVKGVSDL